MIKKLFILLCLLIIGNPGYCQGLISDGDSIVIHIRRHYDTALILKKLNDSVNAEYVIFNEDSSGELPDFFKKNYNKRIVLKEWIMTDEHRAFINGILSKLRALKAEQIRLQKEEGEIHVRTGIRDRIMIFASPDIELQYDDTLWNLNIQRQIVECFDIKIPSRRAR